MNEITEEVYLTPVFASDVTDPRNQHIFTIVTERAYTDLQVSFIYYISGDGI